MQQLKSFQARAPKQLHHHLDDLGVHRRRFRTDRLRADLVELAVTALLRPLAAEHRADVVQLLQARLLIQAMLDVSAHHRRGGFRTQRERTSVAIVESIHFLADDVGFLPHAAREQSRLFQNRRADLLIVVDSKHLARNGFHLIPGRAGGGKDIASAFDCFNHERFRSSLIRAATVREWSVNRLLTRAAFKPVRPGKPARLPRNGRRSRENARAPRR